MNFLDMIRDPHMDESSNNRKKLFYRNREDKARYVYETYSKFINGKVLDVGSDKCYLKKYLSGETQYIGIGLGGSPDIQVNLEEEKIPFPDSFFDCVLCLDVLEHLDNIHETFDELCRVSKKYIIISLPNAWATFYKLLRFGEYLPGQSTKFYGLPVERPADRHKWFFSASEAENFIKYRSGKNGYTVITIHYTGVGGEGKGVIAKIREVARTILVRDTININDLYVNTLWALIEKNCSH